MQNKFMHQTSFAQMMLCVICFSCFILAENPVSVPLGHPVYQLIDRMETKGIIGNAVDGVKPFPRHRVARILQSIDSKRSELTRIDKQELDNALLDFRYDFKKDDKYPQALAGKPWYTPLWGIRQIKKETKRFFRQNQPEEQNYLFLWEDSAASFYMDYIEDLTIDAKSDSASVWRMKNEQIHRFRGTYGERFGYGFEISLMALRGDSAYRANDPVLKSTWRNIVGGLTAFDRSGGQIAYHFPFGMDFGFAQQPLAWGLGRSGQLILSDNVEQYPYIYIRKEWKWGAFNYLHGKLLAWPNDSLKALPLYPDKWVAAHRLEISPGKIFCIGLTESNIYGYRYADWAYLMPMNLYRAVEHNLGDRDNKTISLDAELVLPGNIKAYGTFFLDELRKSAFFSDWYGNKQAYQIGAIAEDPFGLPNLSLLGEYVAIMPWVYTHRYDINRYINGNRSLGHWAGPNSEIIFASIAKDWHHRFSTSLKMTRSRHGDNGNENIGGDIFVGHDSVFTATGQILPRVTRQFLEGVLSTRMTYDLTLNVEPFNDLFLSLALKHQEEKTSAVTSRFQEIYFRFRLDY